MQVNIYEAKARLSALLEVVQAGEEVIIVRAGKPIARLSAIAPLDSNRSGVRFGGLDVESLRLSTDFHEPLTDDELVGA